MQPRAFHLITCEYPPAIGGVADHTRALASALAAADVAVHVWSPGTDRAPEVAPGIHVHVLPDEFGPVSLRALQHGLGTGRTRHRLFVQWVPHGYGRRSLNVSFCTWVLRRARVHGDRVEVMIHEPYLAWSRERLRQTAAALVHRMMLSTLLAAATSVWLATPSFEPYVRPYGFGRALGYHWLPLPSPLTVTSDADLIARVGARWRRPIVAHFGTFNPLVTAALGPVIERVLTVRPDVTWLLVGRDGERFTRDFGALAPHLADRLVATGTLDASQLSAHLLAADLFVQPYPDGVTARRTTATALLAHGRPIVTTDGHLTEPFWRADDAVRLAPAGNADALAQAAIDLLAAPPARAMLGGAAERMFARRFSIAQAVAALTATG